jgi:DEAD/DEAH box helicase domain-containing protein
LLLMCDPSDLGRSVGDRSTDWFVQSGPDGLGFYSASADVEPANPEWLASFDPTVFLYDNFPGGVGFSEKLFQSHDPALEQVRRMIESCSCDEGCPTCVGPVVELGARTRQLALEILGLICRKATVTH